MTLHERKGDVVFDTDEFPRLTSLEKLAVCHYLDETHAEIDGVRYAVREFAQRMEQNKISYAPA